MELKRRFNWRRLATIIYVVAFAIYLIVGLQPAEAVQYEISNSLTIPSIGLTTDVTKLQLVEHRLDTPDTIVGSYSRAHNKTLLIGHSSTVFRDLNLVTVGSELQYDGKVYKIRQIELYRKVDVDMDKVLAPAAEDTIIVMTCAGEAVSATDATHRLIVTAVAE